MNQKNQFTIIEFSRLTGIKRENLRFYDRIGLLTPDSRGANNYRQYSRQQLSSAYLISNLRALGVSIENIKKYAEKSTPENTLVLFAQQEARIQEEIRQMREASLIMRIHADMIRETLSHDENALFLEKKGRENIFLCPSIPADMDDDEGGLFSYEYAEANGINLGFPQGTLIAGAQLGSGDRMLGDRYYFKVGRGGNGWKPAGLYAVAYGRCDLWKPEAVYLRLFDFIKEQGMSICGDAYEEYPAGDAVTQDRGQSCIRVEIPVIKAALQNGSFLQEITGTQ